MLVLCHIFFGLLLGAVTGYLLSDRNAIIFVLFGSLLPDIIDKPLGHIILADSIGDGRIFCHSLLFIAVFSCVAFLVWRRYGSMLMLYLVLGIFAHQLMDAMWMVPVHWYWPFLGPYPLQSGYGEGYFTSQFIREITSPSEWIFFMIVSFLAVVFYMEIRNGSGFSVFKRMKCVFSSLLLMMGIFFLWLGVAGEWDYPLAYVFPENMFILAVISFAGFALIMVFGEELFSFTAKGGKR